MLRALCYKTCQDITLKSIQKTLLNTTKYVNIHFNRSKLYSSCICSTYNIDNEKRKAHRYSLPMHLGYSPFHTSSHLTIANVIDMNKVSVNFWKIRMEDLKQVPLPAFWLGMCGLMPIMLPPLSSFIIGYSHFLSNIQYLYSATLLSCMGGIKWGSLIENKPATNWENYTLSIVPCIIAVIALLVPKFLGYIILMGGFLAAFIIDLSTSAYPVWFIALRGVLTNISVFFLLISMLQKLVH